MSADPSSTPRSGQPASGKHDAPPAPAHAGPALPTALVTGPRRVSPLWIVPLGALALALVLGWEAWGRSGLPITIQLDDGHGLKAGDALRHRGIVVGEVQDVRLLPNSAGVLAEVRVADDAAHLARAGSRFWVVRPELGLAGIVGLDTLVGARYLALIPGDGAPQRDFVGLSGAPVADALLPGLEVVLESGTRGNLRTGSPVLYRRLRVGSVLSVALSSDGRSVEVLARIRHEFAPLVQSGTRFWHTGGLTVDAGLTGLNVKFDSFEALVVGGIALACPPGQQPAVNTGHRFALEPEARAEWLAWQPAVSIGHELLPDGRSLVRPERAALIWRAGRIFSGDERREGWVLPVAGGVLGPSDLLTAPEGAHADTVFLEVAGQRHAIPAANPDDAEEAGDAPTLLRLALPFDPPLLPWPAERERRPGQPEDSIVVGEPGEPPVSLSAGRFTAVDTGWDVDSALTLDPRWHGAVVQARSDGAVVGVLVVHDGGARVLPLP